MEDFNIWEVIGVSGLLFGLAAFLMGQALAETWRPAWQNVVYGLLLALGNRFIDCALFDSEWLSLPHYVVDAVIVTAISYFAYRVTLARKMANQYPWLYERATLFTWRERTGNGSAQ
jgi:hypothetical protein